MTKSFRRKVLLLFFSIATGALSGGSEEIRFKSDAKVQGPLVKLRDVAVVRSDSNTQLETLSDITLFPAPGADRPRLVRSVDVRQLLRLHGVEIEKFQFSGPTVIRVTCEKPTIETSEATSAKSEAKPLETVERLVARRALSAGETIERDDVEIATVPNKSIPTTEIRSIETAVGQELTRGLDAGQPIDGRFLKRPVIVQKGQTISVVARGNGVQARTTAKAIENGSRGDQILVESFDSKEKFVVAITGRQQAEIIVNSRVSPERPSTSGSAVELTRRPTVSGDKESKE